MNLRWCAFTGALMLGFVALTFIHKEVAKDPAGVVTRWWDGTMQSKEVRFADGKLASRTEYGDDGITVNKFEEWNDEGKLTHSKIRRKDGRVEEKLFTGDGKTLVLHKLWNGDELSFVVEQLFYPTTGKIRMETIRTDDGINVAELRRYNEQGELIMQYKILDNADQETTQYEGGKLVMRGTFKANGDQWDDTFDADGNLLRREKQIRLTNAMESELFKKDGTLLVHAETQVQPPYTNVITVYEGDKVKYRQIISRRGNIEKIEELSLSTGNPTRVIAVDQNSGDAIRMDVFREDGTLERVITLNSDGTTAKTTEYDATGKTVTSEKDGGEPVTFDKRLLQEATYSFAKER